VANLCGRQLGKAKTVPCIGKGSQRRSPVGESNLKPMEAREKEEEGDKESHHEGKMIN